MSYKVGRKYTDNFLRLLGSPVLSIPKGAQWVVLFEDLERFILPGIDLALDYDTALRTNNKWKITRASAAVLGEDYQKNAGCVFCQAIGLPGESIVTNPVGFSEGPFLRTYVVSNREAFSVMRMTFLDTHVSFADNFLRPWAISTATFGMIGRMRTEPKNYRTNIHCYKIGGDGSAPSEIMHWTFFDACCVSVSEEENNYSPSNNFVGREARFVYNSYSIDSEENPFANMRRK